MAIKKAVSVSTHRFFYTGLSFDYMPIFFLMALITSSLEVAVTVINKPSFS